jgi:putative heme-binding domain-containing protein
VVARGASLAKGDAAAGGRLFRTNCSGCHAIRGEGGFSGPDLTNVASVRSLAELRKALLEPSADVAAEHWSVALRLNSGRKLAGTRLNEDSHSIQLRDSQGRLVSVLRRDVADMELVRRSAMPPFEGKLSEAEINNLLAFLTRLRGER